MDVSVDIQVPSPRFSALQYVTIGPSRHFCPWITSAFGESRHRSCRKAVPSSRLSEMPFEQSYNQAQ
jgi:hypothetical protein